MEEFLALNSNQILELVPQPPRGPIIGSKWVLSLKVGSHYSLEWYKAHLVAQDFINKNMVLIMMRPLHELQR